VIGNDIGQVILRQSAHVKNWDLKHGDIEHVLHAHQKDAIKPTDFKD
jgi:hypothetical protein